MAADKSKSLIMAQRLKDLRTEKGLSHESLRKALMEKYEIDISIDSLKNYEVSKPHHAKQYKNEGMRVEYLRCLADFFGVSADYLLGTSDVAASDPSLVNACLFTGLDAKSINAISKLTAYQKKDLESILSHRHLSNMLFSLGKSRDIAEKCMQHDAKIHAEEERADDEVLAACDYLEGHFIASIPFYDAIDLYLEQAKSDFAFIVSNPED